MSCVWGNVFLVFMILTTAASIAYCLSALTSSSTFACSSGWNPIKSFLAFSNSYYILPFPSSGPERFWCGTASPGWQCWLWICRLSWSEKKSFHLISKKCEMNLNFIIKPRHKPTHISPLGRFEQHSHLCTGQRLKCSLQFFGFWKFNLLYPNSSFSPKIIIAVCEK